MASNDYDVYVSECISLARSLVIKSEQTINAINRYLQQVGHSVPDASANNGEGWKEWKYYLNVNGEYYLDPLTPDSPRLGYDEKMYITSLDTQTEILFDKSTLALNPLTLSEYKGYGRYYEALVTKYPEQVELIRRILNPVDMDAAWEAKNYAILQYDTNFVDFNEFNLIDELQSWIYRFTGRYDTDAFAISHRYYAASQLGIIYLMILGEIINIRLKNCKTPFAHSYHVWNYLGDYYGLDKFKDLIYHDQALWLYRNIDELVVKGGIKETLDFLKKEFSEPFGLHLKSIELEKDTVKLLESLSFEPFITKHPYGTNPAVYGTRSDVARLYDQLKGQAFLNGVLQKEKEVEVADSLKYSTRNSFATGIIECDSSQEAQVGLVNYIAERFNNWLFLAAERTSPEWQDIPGSFPLKFPLDVPGSGTVLVSPAEAAAIMMFIGRRLQNDSDDVIPSFWVREVPYMDESVDYVALIKSGTESRFLTDERIAFILDGMDDIQPRQITSVEAYLEYVDAIVNKKAVLALMVGSENDPLGKSQLREAIDCLFVDAYCKLTPFTTFSELFDFMQINMDFIGVEEYATISGQIVSMLVGNIQTNEGLSSPYFEIMEIMRLLSKYTTMFVPGQRNAYEILDWPMLGITLEEETSITEAYIPTPNIEHTVKLSNFDIGGVEIDSVPDSSDVETEMTLSGNADAGLIHTLDEGSAYDHTVYSLQPTPDSLSLKVKFPIQHNMVVSPWFTDDIPEDKVLLDGSELLISEYPDLYQLFEDNFGIPSQGSLYFKLPDMRGDTIKSRILPTDGVRIGDRGESQVMDHNHGITARGLATGIINQSNGPKRANIQSSSVLRTSYSGGNETRMNNISCHWVIDRYLHGSKRLVGEIGFIFTDKLAINTIYCDGSVVPSIDYPKLATAINSIYGTDGPGTFKTPDLENMYLRVVAHGSTVDPNRTTRTDRGDGTIGDNVGTRQTSLCGSHSHTFRISGVQAVGGGHDTNNILQQLGANSSATTIQLGTLDMDYNEGEFGGRMEMRHMVLTPVIFFDDVDVLSQPAVTEPAGSFKFWPLPSEPLGWKIVTTSLLNIQDHPDLFGVFGTMYGGDGVTTFGLPSVNGRTLRGVNGGSGRDPDATSRTDRGDGTTGDNVGTLQSHSYRSHRHSTVGGNGNSNGGVVLNLGTSSSSWGTHSYGGVESRVDNVYLNLLVKVTDL